jgi:sugar phosphate isomerase/epimerase
MNGVPPTADEKERRMPRPVTLFTGQWADLPLETLAEKVSQWGFDGLELACWGDHFDVATALSNDRYVEETRALLEQYNLRCFAISNHLVGQCVCDPIDQRHKAILPPRIWGDGEPEGVRQRAAEEIKNTARAARRLGVNVVNGFTGSSVWSKLYFFPPTSQADIDAGYQDFAERWGPILDVFQEEGVRFALEVHPTEIAYDIITARRTLDAVGNHPAFGFNFDPSHFIHQFVNPVAFIEEFPDRIFHVHVKDSRVQLTGRNSILSSHLDFGDPRRGWDFVSPGHGDVKWDPIIRTLNRIGYDGPLSIEWEDSGMDRDHGAPEALALVRSQDFPASATAFDAAFARE